MIPATETSKVATHVGVKRVLAPLDGSQHAEAALRWLHLLPAAHLTLLQVCQPDPADRSRAEAYLADVRERLCPADLAVETCVVAGGPAEAIVNAASDADLVVMCTRGAGAGGRLLFGSVADRVARHSPSPALLIRGEPATSEVKIRRVVVPLDGSLAAERALPLALVLASALDGPIHIVTVKEPDAADAARSDTSIGVYLEQQTTIARAAGIAVTTEQRSGTPASELLAIVTAGDLLVMTTHGRGAARRWQIGSVAEKLLRQATAPVALVRADSF